MSGNRWEQPSIPHKGWKCVGVIDLRSGGESAEESDQAVDVVVYENMFRK